MITESVRCDICSKKPEYVCDCRRCASEEDASKFHSCEIHKDSVELTEKHFRIYPSHTISLRRIGSKSDVAAEQKGPAEDDIRDVCGEIADMLVEKNKAYGNSALDPVRIFSKASPVEQILVRLDDKLSRLSRGEAGGEDVELDLIGYLVLLRVARRRS